MKQENTVRLWFSFFLYTQIICENQIIKDIAENSDILTLYCRQISVGKYVPTDWKPLISMYLHKLYVNDEF